jgi:hypothetical protein
VEVAEVEVAEVVEEHDGAYPPCHSSPHQEILTVSLTLPFGSSGFVLRAEMSPLRLQHGLQKPGRAQRGTGRTSHVDQSQQTTVWFRPRHRRR